MLQHDLLVGMLRAGEQSRVLMEQQFDLGDERQRAALEQSTDISDWFERVGRLDDRNRALRFNVFRPLLSDFLRFVFEGLTCSRKGKLCVAYGLLRKPLQDNLCLFEAMVVDPDDFSNQLAADPLKLRSSKVGDVDVHARRIERVLDILGERDRFDAAYVAQLRHGKGAEDGFDGVCNQALHLFTDHHAIRTEGMNINFIFSGEEQHLTQWRYLCSRLPHLLFYSRRVIEHPCAQFAPADPGYLADMERRVAAATLLWEPTIHEDYRSEPLVHFARITGAHLDAQCKKLVGRSPSGGDLLRLRDQGALPGESVLRTSARNIGYALQDALVRVEQRVRQFGALDDDD